MGKIAKNYIYNLIYQIISIIVPLVTAPYVVRVLGAKGTGIYSYVNSLVSLITTFAMLGLFGYGNRQIAYVRDDKEKLDSTFWRIMSIRAFIGVFATFVYVIVVLLNGRYYFYFFLYYTYLLGYVVDCTWLFVGVEDMKWAVLKNIFLKLFATAMIFIFVNDTSDVGIYIFIQGGSILFANLLAYSQLKRYVGKPKFILSNVKDDIYGSFMLFLPGMAATIYLQCDKIMIEWLGSNTAQVAQYDYAEKIVTIPLSFITVLSTVMMPRLANEFANGREHNISILLNKAARISLFLAFPLSLGMVAISMKLIPWYLGREFFSSITVINIISPIIITNTLTEISGNQYFTATNQIGILLKAQVTACIGNIIINALLIPHYGLYGAAVATLISSAVCAIVQYVYLCKQVKLPGLLYSSIKYLLFAVIMFIAIVSLTSGMEATPMTNIIQVFVGVVIYFGLCMITKDKTFFNLISVIQKKFKR